MSQATTRGTAVGSALMQSAARYPMMSWLPVAQDFRGVFHSAIAQADPVDRLESLAALAAHQLSFVETLQLDRGLMQLGLPKACGFQQIRLAILASSTVDHLLPPIRIGGLRRRLLIDLYKGPYGQYQQQLLDPAAALHRFAPEAVLFSLSSRDAIADIPVDATTKDVDDSIGRFVEGLRSLWQRARQATDAMVIQQTFLNTMRPLFGNYDRLVPGAPSRLIGQLNERLCKAAADDQVSILDVAGASERDGIDAWFDAGRWFQGKMEIAPPAAPLYGDLVARILAAQYGLSRKCLVFDLDNTLWGGVIGDDGIDGIIIGEGSAAGEAYLALQHYAKQLKERGIILAVCSKNEIETAESVFREHPEMMLRLGDFAAFLANWNDKAENLKAIAERLNIGLDSLVFVDDNPIERARIRQSLPMVEVPELPEDPSHYARCIADAGYFEAATFTSEDRDRARQYAANAEREELLELAESMDDFLHGLEMTVVYGPFKAVDQPRIVQLINKTNQFNTTTRRYTAEEIQQIVEHPRALTLQFRLLDRIGDNGLVSTMILRPTPEREDVLEVENWVMSCRVFGRELEFEAMNIAVETALQRGVCMFVGNYIATSKNAVISGLYPSLGFTSADQPRLANGTTRWSLHLSQYVMRDSHIARAGAAA